MPLCLLLVVFFCFFLECNMPAPLEKAKCQRSVSTCLLGETMTQVSGLIQKSLKNKHQVRKISLCGSSAQVIFCITHWYDISTKEEALVWFCFFLRRVLSTFQVKCPIVFWKKLKYFCSVTYVFERSDVFLKSKCTLRNTSYSFYLCIFTATFKILNSPLPPALYLLQNGLENQPVPTSRVSSLFFFLLGHLGPLPKWQVVLFTVLPPALHES